MDVDYAPVTGAYTPLVFVALEFFASCGPWSSGEGFDFSNDAGKHIIGQRFQFLPCGRLHLDGVITHAADRVIQGRL